MGSGPLQILHLLIVDGGRRVALVGRHGSRWVLPVATCHERARVDMLIGRWAADHGTPGDVAGHWLGRLTPAADSIDWLVAINASATAAPPGLSWAPLGALASGRSLLDYQQWAMTRVLHSGELPSVPGPFGNMTWPRDVRAWLATVIDEPPPWTMTPYRVGAHELVLGVETSRRRVFFKGLDAGRAGEATLTRTLSAFAPDVFARTLAIERRPDGSTWWLAAECAGRPAHRSDLVARALARIQQRVMASALVVRQLPALDLDGAMAWATELLDDARATPALRQARDAVMCATVPQSWIPLDLDPNNVLVDDGGAVRFIDLDDSFLGPSPMAMAVFARRCRERALYRIYEEAWSPPLQAVNWPDFELAAAVIDAWLGWKRVQRNTDRGEVHGAVDLTETRLVQRLGAALSRR